MSDNNEPAGSAVSRFMASSAGRIARAALGVLVISSGLAAGGLTGLGIATAGLVPLAAGVFNACPVAPLWGGHFRGAAYCSGHAETSGDARSPRGDR